MVQYDRKSGEIELKNVNPLQYKGFHENGAIHFFNLRLSDIVSDLERIFGTKVVLLDESLADTRYFAWFTNNETLEQILKGINADGKMSFASRNGVIYISRR
jgi:ferric-dicitrate binding protein FerR (iron transport regulator)